MKKLVSILILCVFCMCCAFGFTACDFGMPNNSGKEITNEQPEDKDKEENNNQNNSEENNNEEEIVVITKDTDFDALESDKVEKDVFINAMLSYIRIAHYHTPAKTNCTIDIKIPYGCGILKIDGLKRFTNLYGYDHYMIFDENSQSFIEACKLREEIYLGEERDVYNPDMVKMNEISGKLWDNAIYNETAKQYEISQFGYDNLITWSDVQIKIKDGYIVFLEITTNYYDEQSPKIETGCVKCYDFGTTVVDIPDDIMAAMNAK